MSVVVAYNSRYGTIMGSDTRTSLGDGLVLPAEPKVWRCGDILYGAVGDAGSFARIKALDLCDRLTNESPAEFCYEQVIPRLDKEGLLNQDGTANWDMLVGHPLGAVYVDSFGAVEFFSCPFVAIGSGANFALGCGFQLQDDLDNWRIGINDVEEAAMLVAQCVKAGCEFDPACGGDAHVLFQEIDE